MKIENRTFIISGGSSGLGLATAKDLLASKAYVAILDSSAPDDAAFPEPGEKERTLYVKMDVTNTEDVQNAVNRTVEWTKKTGAELGGVINCAGVARNEQIISRKGKTTNLDIWNLVTGVNVTGTYNLTRLALEHLVHVKPEDTPDAERGVIIMVSSEAAFDGQPGQVAYAASKGAIRSMTIPMARDLGRHNIRVVSLAPGPFGTPMLHSLSDPVLAQIKKGALLYPKRFGLPEEFAKTVRWVLETAFINGETLRVTGGGRVPAFL